MEKSEAQEDHVTSLNYEGVSGREPPHEGS